MRLSSPRCAKSIASRFEGTPTIQLKGLDDVGCPPNTDSKPISIEVVEGAREELYWLKVPEKVRAQAVAKAVLSIKAEGVTKEQKRKLEEGGQGVGEHKRRRKR